MFEAWLFSPQKIVPTLRSLRFIQKKGEKAALMIQRAKLQIRRRRQESSKIVKENNGAANFDGESVSALIKSHVESFGQENRKVLFYIFMFICHELMGVFQHETWLIC